MPKTTVHRNDGTLLGELPSVAEEPPFTPKSEQVKVGSGAGFYAYVIRPHNFDATKRYPVVLYVYGGPSTDQVRLNAVGDDATVEIGGSAGAVHYTSALERLIVDTLGGDDVVTLDDNRAEAVPYMLDWLLDEVNRPRGQTRFP